MSKLVRYVVQVGLEKAIQYLQNNLIFFFKKLAHGLEVSV